MAKSFEVGKGIRIINTICLYRGGKSYKYL